ncbi:MAG: SUMF1/EgtB/PvdO family nonheme iron enzyme [Nitrospira sp.]|nr:SUMF1/EgtB/PvdO family nonheme iron enzyme [Nitrospira sp.]
MSKIFISHSSQDNAKALAVAQWLEQNGWGEYFLDISPARGLAPGERWQTALKTAADRCEVVLVLISPAWRDSKWCLAEFLQAKQLGKTIVGVIVEPTPIETLLKELTAEWQLCDLQSGAEQQTFRVFQDQIVPQTEVSLSAAGLAGLRQGLQKVGLDPLVFPWPPSHDPERLPYRGLRALEAEDAAVFFGREAPLIRALDTLRRMEDGGEHVFVILGASGSGKSSFMRAGLWPRLKRDDRRFLALPVIRPERSAITGQNGLLESLEKAFREYKVPKTRAALRTALAKPDGIVGLVVALQTAAQNMLGEAASPPTLLLAIDQAEELFSKDGGEEVGHLLDMLSLLVRRPVNDGLGEEIRFPRVLIMAAIRSDAYDHLQRAPALAGIRQTPFSLPPLAPAEYKMVIEGPAARATAAGRRLSIAPDLTEQLLQDAEGADALPLLACILERLITEFGADGDLRLDGYQALGGLKGSIEAAVSEALKDPRLDPVIPADEATQRRLLQQAFPFLVTLDHDFERPKRLVATWSAIGSDAHPLLDRLVNARLLLKDKRVVAEGQETIVLEVTHEALIRHWPLLKGWVDANRELLAWQHQLRSKIHEWNRNRQNPDLLLHGLPLRDASERMKRMPTFFSQEEHRFVAASYRYSRRRSLVVSVIAGVVVLVMAGTIWLWQKGYSIEQAGLKVTSLVIGIQKDPDMVLIGGGTFHQGDSEGADESCQRGESWRRPVHAVTLQSFELGKYEVTFDEYDRFAIATGRRLPEDEGWGRGRRPVIDVSWKEAQAYTEWLSKQTGKPYRLSSESEWEYAARSGAKQEAWAGTSQESQLGQYAVFDGNSGERTAEVGSKQSNSLGLYDLSGNVWEWVEDCEHATYEGAPENGSAWLEPKGSKCVRHVVRGGSWGYKSESLRVSDRGRGVVDLRNARVGFRLAKDAEK